MNNPYTLLKQELTGFLKGKEIIIFTGANNVGKSSRNLPNCK